MLLYTGKYKDILMGKNKGLSTIGYAIVLVIILAVVIIISAPMMADKYKGDKEKQQTQKDAIQNRQSSRQSRSDDIMLFVQEEMRNIESRLSSRIDALEMRQSELNSSGSESNYNQEISDRYVCEIEGIKNEFGNTVPITDDTDITAQKIVFVCEYRR